MHLDSIPTKFDQWRVQNQLIEVKLKMSKIAIASWKLFKLSEMKIRISKFSHRDYEKISIKMKKNDPNVIYKIEILFDRYLHDRGHKSKISNRRIEEEYDSEKM